MGDLNPAGELRLLHNDEVLERVSLRQITSLTQKATNATFYCDGLSAEQQAANQRIVDISAATCADAARSGVQRFSAAFIDNAFAGYVIATRHAPLDLELDWLMVDPAFHGSGVAAALMDDGIDWLGRSQPIWLNVIAYNERAISFYRKFGFEVDEDAKAPQVVPHLIMRRAPDPR